jgi:hypothetical protein
VLLIINIALNNSPHYFKYHFNKISIIFTKQLQSTIHKLWEVLTLGLFTTSQVMNLFTLYRSMKNYIQMEPKN